MADAMRTRQQGFSLLEVAIALAVVGLIVGVGLRLGSGFLASQRVTTAEGQVEDIEAALIRFATVNRRLPCPDDGAAADGREDRAINGTCTALARGIVPWVTLGLPESAALDPWGRRISFRVDDTAASGVTRDNGVDMSACDPSTPSTGQVANCVSGARSAPTDFLDAKGLLILESPGGRVIANPTGTPPTGAAYILISHGKNGLGAYLQAGGYNGNPTAAYEVPNRNNQGLPGAGFIDARFNDAEGSAIYFDDIVRSKTILAVAEAAGLGPRFEGGGTAQNSFNIDDSGALAKIAGTTDQSTSPTPTRAPKIGSNPDGSGGNAVVFGVESGGDFGANPTGTTSCFWIDQAFDWTTQDLRALFKFQFIPGETTETDTGAGEGITLTFLPGAQVTTDPIKGVVCGRTSGNFSLGYKDGVPLPKSALKIDTYNNTFAEPTKITANHASMMITHSASQDFVGNGAGANPPCNAGGPALNGAAGACTYRQAPLAAPLQRWMEERDPDTLDYITGGIAAKRYLVRVEAKRGCNRTGTDPQGVCTNCGGAGNFIHTKAWIVCDDDDGCPELAGLPGIEDLDAAFAPNSVNMVNYCGIDPSKQGTWPAQGLTYDTVKLGFTMGSLGSGSGVLITKVQIKSVAP